MCKLLFNAGKIFHRLHNSDRCFFNLCWHILFILLSIALTQGALANCSIENNTRPLTLAYSSYDDFKSDTASEFEFDAIESLIAWREKQWGAQHQYIALDFPSDSIDTPVTNGDLHLLIASYQSQEKLSPKKMLLWEMAPTMAVSSNQLKHTGELQASSFRLDGYIALKHDMNEISRYYAGICLGGLSGDYEAIPLLAIDFSYQSLQTFIGYPHTLLTWKINKTFSVNYDWSLTGNEWEIMDKQRTRRSDFRLESQQSQFGFNLSFTSFAVNLSWIIVHDSKINYLARSGSRISADIGGSNALMLRVSSTL